jgi:hypothetical protein
MRQLSLRVAANNLEALASGNPLRLLLVRALCEDHGSEGGAVKRYDEPVVLEAAGE